MRKSLRYAKILLILIISIVSVLFGISQGLKTNVFDMLRYNNGSGQDSKQALTHMRENTSYKQSHNNEDSKDKPDLQALNSIKPPKSTSETDAEESEEKAPETLIPSEQSSCNDNKSIPYDKLISMENIGFMDKLSIIAISGKIKKSNLDRIQNIAEDGVTQEDISEIKEIVKADLSEKDINKLMKIFNKNMDLYAQGK